MSPGRQEARVELFEDYAGRWLDGAVHLGEGTRRKYLGHFRVHINPAFGDRPLDAIHRSHVQAWVAAMYRAGSAPGTCATVYRTFAAIMRSAEVDQVITRSPCIDIRMPRDDDPQEMQFLEPAEMLRLAEAIHPRYRAMVLVAGFSGCRFSELAALKAGAVNVLKGTIEIRGALTEDGGTLNYHRTKTSKSRRTVTLPRSVAQELGIHLGEFPSAQGFVFSAPKGGPIRRRAWMKRFFKPALEKAGLAPGMGFHALRHGHASMLIGDGAPVTVVSARLGHAKASTTLDVYSHLFRSVEEQAVEGLEATFRGTGARQAT